MPTLSRLFLFPSFRCPVLLLPCPYELGLQLPLPPPSPNFPVPSIAFFSEQGQVEEFELQAVSSFLSPPVGPFTRPAALLKSGTFSHKKRNQGALFGVFVKAKPSSFY